MKKIYLIALIMLLIILSACQEKMVPFPDAIIADFTIVHADDDFTIWKRTTHDNIIGISASFPSATYDFPNKTCSANFGNFYFLLQYGNDFYYIGEGFKIDLYGPYDLEEYGITFTCNDK